MTVTEQAAPPARTFGSGALGVAAAADNRLSLTGRSVAGTRLVATGLQQTAGAVSARGAVQPSALPFTGAQGLVALLALGLGAVGAGALVHRLGHRSSAHTG